MKKTLKLLACMVACATSVFAQWTQPVPNFVPMADDGEVIARLDVSKETHSDVLNDTLAVYSEDSDSEYINMATRVIKAQDEKFSKMATQLRVSSNNQANNLIDTYFLNADFSSSNGWSKYLSTQFANAEMGNIGLLTINSVQSKTDLTHTADMYCAGISARWDNNYVAWQQTSKINLPAGRYQLMFDVSNPNNSTNYNMASLTYVEVDGEMFYDEDFTAAKLVNATDWVAHTIEFTINTDCLITISFGYHNYENKGSNDTPEIFISNIALFEGNDIKYINMINNRDRLVRLHGNYIDKNGFYLYSAKSVEEYQTVIELAEEMSNITSSDELESLTERINVLIDAIEMEKIDYEQWRMLFSQIEQAYTNYQNVSIGGEVITSLYSEVFTNLKTGAYYNIDGLEDCQNRYNEALTLIKEHILDNITEGTDITILLTNPNFDNNSSDGWILDNCTWTNIAAECAEMYQKNFNVYQILTGLPQGRYEVKLQGFVRQGFSQYAFDKHNDGTEDIKAYIYSTSDGVTVKTPFRSIYDGKNETQVFFNPDNLPNPVGYVDSKITDNDGNVFYVPNGMAGFAAYEALGDDRYATTAELLVVDGTLRFGAACDNYMDNGFWCIFDSFQLKYVSKDLIGVLKVIYGKDIDQLIAYRDDILKSQLLPPSISSSIVELRIALDNAEDIEIIKEIKRKSEAWKEGIDAYIAGNIPFLPYTLEYSPYQDECTVTVTPTVKDGIYLWMNEDNNEQKDEFVNCISTIKFPADLIGKEDETTMTITVYEVETDNQNNQFIMASNTIQLTLSDPTINIEILDSEWNALQNYVEELENQGNQIEWDLSQGKSGVNKLKGLLIKRGYVTSINLSNKGLSGELPSSLIKFSLLQNLDLSHNNFVGNAGTIVSQLANLTSLNLSYNQFSDLYPMISPNVTSLDISHQTIDRVVPLNLSGMNIEDIVTTMPSILLYDHENQTYDPNINLLCTTGATGIVGDDDWAIQLAIYDGNMTLPYVSPNNAYHGESGDVLNGFDMESGSSFKIALNFNQGDANFVGGIDATDLQATILYAFGGYKNYPFNFTAADTYKDDNINVQDVICTVNIILAQAASQAKTMRKSKSLPEANEAEAFIYMQDGKVVLYSDKPVAAMSLKALGDITWKLEEYGMTQTISRSNVVGYSLSGMTLPVGETVIGTYTGNASITYMSLADAEAQAVSVALSENTVTGLEPANESLGEEALFFDITGRKVNGLNKGVNIKKIGSKTIKVVNK